MRIFLTKTPVVITFALICCALWGSAFPCIKIGYRMFAVGGNDTASQILFAGIRFLLAGLMVILICSFIYKKPSPEREKCASTPFPRLMITTPINPIRHPSIFLDVTFSILNNRPDTRIARKTFAASMIAALLPVVFARPT